MRVLHLATTYPLQRAAAADVGDARIDVVIGRRGVLCEERSRGHDHAGLAVAALRNVELRPGLLHRMVAVFRQSLDGGDFLACLYGVGWIDAGPDRIAVDVHGACAALGNAAAVFGTRESRLFPQDP